MTAYYNDNAAYPCEKRAVEWKHIAGYFHPRSDVLPSDWAERDKRVAEGDYIRSPWRWDLTPYLREIVDFAARPWEYGANKGVVLKSAQVGYTQGVIGTLIGWTIVESPAPMMLLLPSNEEAKRFSRTKLTDILTTSPAVSDRLTVIPELSRGRGLRQASSTMLYQDFPGGFLLLGGAESDVTTRSQVVKRAFVDEADEMRTKGEGQGDVLDRLKRRIDQFPRDGVMLIGSSPSNEATSVVWREWLQSDQRKWFCPCPHCGEFQEWEFGGVDVPHGLKWPTRWVCCGETVRKTCGTCGSRPGDRGNRHPVHDTEDPYYVCVHCRGTITRDQKPAMVQAGEWRATRPEGRYPGWKLSVLFSLLGAKAEWSYVAQEWVDTIGNREKLRVFKNTMLGEVWTGQEEYTGGGSDSYEGRAERYPDHRKGGPLEIPDGVGVLVASVDVHGKWAEVLVRGYGTDDESWDILHQRIEDVSPYEDEMWRRIYHYISRQYHASADGSALGISTTLIDSGGAWTREVYEFCGPLRLQNVLAYKGNYQGVRPLKPGARDGERKRMGAALWHVDTDAYKTTLSGRLAIARPGPGFMHLRAHDRRLCNGHDAEYFAQLRSERRVLTRDRWNHDRYKWEKLRENHAWDLHVMCLAAFDVLRRNHPDLNRREFMEELVADIRHGPTVEDK